MRLLLTLAFCFLPLFCQAQEEKELSEVKKDINGWYSEYIKDFLNDVGKGPTSFVIAKNIATRDLIALLKKAEEEAAKSKDLFYFDSDFLLDAQDWADNWSIEVDAIRKEPPGIAAKMRRNLGLQSADDREMTLHLLREDGLWKINDIVYEAKKDSGTSSRGISSGRSTLRELLAAKESDKK
ncbi:MAG: DUF3828 domain-containing protein [SAR324 cluster bacterium]|uniref:DUF3828 domain-containing protein n=1 Tax=SAR324 cluster bacterium TaxID=2024889 RepID=A0A7X9FS05_9DELT|nr:DUF3828 domain-containing protein [SAR324 cluster bacterium]